MGSQKRLTALVVMVFILSVAATLRLPDLPTVPPGLHYDEAANAILATEIGLQGERPIFIRSYTGKEALFFYLAGGLIRLIGSSVFALRLTAAFVGLLTVAVTYWLGRELTRDRRLALAAAALLAISFWHLIFSRMGFRAITEPLLQGLTVAALWRGLRRDDWRWLLTGGLFLGLTAYTYLAARLFPVVLLLAFLPLLLSRQDWRKRWLQLGAVGLVALVVLSPLLAYFIANPAAFWVRITQVSPGQETLSLGESMLRSVGMFFVRGDPYIRFNVPLRPLFDWFWGTLLLVGWVTCVARFWREPNGWQRASLLLLVVTPLLMLLPTALATSEIVPSNLRAIGLMPFVFILPPIGLLVLVTDLSRRFELWQITPTMLLVIILLAVSGGLSTDRTYFQEWAQQPALLYESDGDLALAAEFLDRTLVDDREVYVAALHYQHPTVAYLSAQYSRVKWLVGSEAVVFPASGRALYIYPYNSPLREWQRPFFANAASFVSETGPSGSIPYTAYDMDRPGIMTIPNAVDANFGSVVTLLGYDLGLAAAGTSLPITIYWEVAANSPGNYLPFVHLEDAWGYRWGQADSDAYPAAQWQAGEIVVQRMDLPVPVGTPPGTYRLRLGWFDPATGGRLPRLDSNGRYAGDTLIIDQVIVNAGPFPEVLPSPPVWVNTAVRPGLTLLGHDPLPASISTGERLPLAFWWRSDAPQPNLTLRLELYPPDNRGVILGNTEPVHGSYPFSDWRAPQFIIDRQALRVDDDIPPGDYRLQLRILDGAGASLDTLSLGVMTVQQSARLYDPPRMQFPMDATLGSEIKLLGYTLAAADTADQYDLTLVWQALVTPTADYTVFVHLLGVDGACCIWQQDVMPQQGSYATTRWLPGEVVEDSYRLVLPPDLPAGVYPIEVGLYLADTGQRLQVVVPGLPDSDVVLLRPLPRD